LYQISAGKAREPFIHMLRCSQLFNVAVSPDNIILPH